MKQEEYRACMADGLRGKTGLSKKEREQLFCTQSRLCSGKAQSEEEARRMCSMPKLPKWAKDALPPGDEALSCKERVDRVKSDLDVINLKVKVGEASEVRGLAARVLNDVFSCRGGDDVFILTQEAMEDVNDLSKRFYLKGEAKDIQSKVNTLLEVL